MEGARRMKTEDIIKNVSVEPVPKPVRLIDRPDLMVYLPCRGDDPLINEIPQLKQIEKLLEEIREKHPVRNIEIFFNESLIVKESEPG